MGWWILDDQDCETIKLGLSDQQISSITKHKFKNIVKSKISDAAFEYLQTMQKEHSKMKNIKYNKFELSSYLNSPLFNKENRILLLALRTRTVRGIRNDFRGMYADNMCPLGCGDEDTLENVLSCSVLKQHHTSKEVTNTIIKYEDVFSKDIFKQHTATELYNQLFAEKTK